MAFLPRFLTTAVVLALLSVGAATAQTGTTISYQGALLQSGVPATGTHQMEFSLHDDPTAGAQVGGPLFFAAVPVTNGVFQAQLDFGATPFNGDPLWLQVVVDGNPLLPRTPLTAVPHAIRSASVPWTGITGIPADLLDGDDVNDADANPTNELITGFSLTGSMLQLTDAGGTRTVDLSTFEERLKQTILVSPGESIQAAINGITDASATKPYLVKVEPGVYTEQVTLKAFVDLEGSGRDRTIITWTGGPVGPNMNASATTLAIPVATEVRNLTVESITTSGYSSAIRIIDATPSICDVTIRSNGGTTANYPLVARSSGGANVRDCNIETSGVVARGAYMAAGGTLQLRNCRITVFSSGVNGYGADAISGTMNLVDCDILMNGSNSPFGVASTGGALNIRGCKVECTGPAAFGFRFGGAGTSSIVGSSIVAIGTTTTAIGVQAATGAISVSDTSIRSVATTVSQVISISASTALDLRDSNLLGSAPSGSGVSHGGPGSLSIQGCKIEFNSSTGTATGVHNGGGATVQLSDSQITIGAPASNGYGVSASTGNVTVADVIINVAASSANGARADGASTFRVDRSALTATSSGLHASALLASAGTVTINDSVLMATGGTSTNNACYMPLSPTIHASNSSFSALGPGNGGAAFRTEVGSTVTATLRGCTVTNTAAGSTAILLLNSTATIVDSQIAAPGSGIAMNTGTAEVRNSSASGGTHALHVVSGSMRVAHTRIDGPVTGMPTCLGAYDENYIALGGSCE